MGESTTVVLVHWSDGRELDAGRERIEGLGYEVEAWSREGSALMRSLKKRNPAALVIDTSDDPDRSCDLAQSVRARASTADIPLIFVHATADASAARLLAEVPDSTVTEWSRIDVALHRAIKTPIPLHSHVTESATTVTTQVANGDGVATLPEPDAPSLDPTEERRRRRRARRRAIEEARGELDNAIADNTTEPAAVADAVDEAVADAAPDPVPATREEPEIVVIGLGRTRAEQLGVSEDAKLAILAAPQGFAKTLGKLPAGVKLKTSARGKSDVVMLFSKDAAAFEGRLPAAARSVVPGGTMWLSWPASSDLTRERVRARSIAAGLDDVARASLTEHATQSLFEGWSSHRFRQPTN